MRDLEDYLSTDFQLDQLDLTEIEHNLEQVGATFAHVIKDGLWPYQYNVSDPIIEPPRVSQGTQAMVLTAAGRLVGKCDIPGCDKIKLSKAKSDALNAAWNSAREQLVSDLSKTQDEQGQPQANVRSSSFGSNNPITLSHLTELCRSLARDQAEQRTDIQGHLENAKANLKDLFTLNPTLDDLLPDLPGKDDTYLANAFVPLRAVRAANDLKIDIEALKPRFRSVFESALHDQLSFSAIPDSRFDPAELLFCLEGLLLCAPSAVDPRLAGRVLGVLSEKQDTSAHWRPNRPFLASAKGRIMLPLSVEGANSLLRSIALIDGDRLHHTFTPDALPLIRRFWQWLRSRAVRFRLAADDCVGWHSEHVNEPDLIHIWDTSQVAEFMLGYRTLLRRHIARETLVLSGAKVVMESDEHQGDWDYFSNKFEPLLGETNGEKIYERIGDDFVLPRTKGIGPKSYSMLLYGPPGTGKTTVAESLGGVLGWRVITITVSDFLGSGGALVEARAKAVFQMLEAQSEAVILFDEIDAFLLDRGSQFYRDQDTLFQFLTPGMLTKINDLRRKKRSVFVIATNYANRIDPAIKRIGRVDKRYLLAPPNLNRRKAMVEEVVSKEDLAEGVNTPTSKEIDDAARESLFLGWGDLEAAVKGRLKNVAAVMSVALQEANRSTGPEFYGRRFPLERPFHDTEIGAEVQALHRLALEVDEGDAFIEEFEKAAQAAAVKAEAQPSFGKDLAQFLENDLTPIGAETAA